MVTLTFQNRPLTAKRENLIFITVDIPEPKNLVEKQLQEYIIKSLVENGILVASTFRF